MNLHEYNERKIPASQPSNLTNSPDQSSKIPGIVGQVHSLNTLHVMAAFCQILLSAAVVLVSILGFIGPAWLSIVLSMFASVTGVLGTYFLYTSVTNMKDPNRLLGNAIRRVIDARN